MGTKLWSGENLIFFPKEEVVKFVNRFVRKRTGINQFNDLLPDLSSSSRALDYGCGIGRNTILLKEFGFDAYGMDISETSIRSAVMLAETFSPELRPQFELCSGTEIPCKDSFFEFIVCESVLDSMFFEVAKKIVKEFERVVRTYVFISLVSSEDANSEKGKEEIVSTSHEKGTVQSYFDLKKINELISDTCFDIVWDEHHIHKSVTGKYSRGRYYLVLKKSGGNEQ